MDVLLLDLVLPDLSGVEVVEALRGFESTRSLPIFLVTTHELSAEEHARIRNEVHAFFGKGDSSISALVAEIGRVVERTAG